MQALQSELEAKELLNQQLRSKLMLYGDAKDSMTLDGCPPGQKLALKQLANFASTFVKVRLICCCGTCIASVNDVECCC